MHISLWKSMKATRILLVAGISLLYVVQTDAVIDPVKKLDCRLRALIGRADTTTAKPSAMKDEKTGEIIVQVRLHTADDSVLTELEAVGLTVLAHFRGLVTGRIDEDNLLNLAGLKIVSTVYPLRKPLTRAVHGQGVTSTRVDQVREVYPGFTGAGVKVGIISDSFGLVSEATPTIVDIDGDGIEEILGTDSQLAGELPAVVELIQDGTPEVDDFGEPIPFEYSYIDEGRAMAEIVHEMAPDAELAFHSAWLGTAGWAEGIIKLAEAGCKVIVDDIIYLTMPAYQDGEVSQAIEEVSEKYDVVYLSAAGNSYAKVVESAYHDSDPYENEGPWSKIPEGHDFHNWDPEQWDPYLDVHIPPNGYVALSLFWENPYGGTLGPGASTDYDLYLFDKDEYFLWGSDNAQGTEESPMGDAYEFTVISNDSDTEILHIKVAVNKHHGPGVVFKLFFWGSEVYIQSSVRSRDGAMIIGHNKADSTVNVAAVNFTETDSYGYDQNNPRRIDPSYYTSKGGYVIRYFSPIGEPLETPKVRFVPDIACVDGANTSFFGEYSDLDGDEWPNFFGTSAAAPHAAAIVALMRQANPSLSSQEIRNLLREAATDIFEPGVDQYTGWGFLYADEALNAVPGAIVPNTPTPVPTNAPTATPTMTPVPTATPLVSNIILAANQVIVTDNRWTFADLSNGVDYDDPENSDLTIRWNIPFDDIVDFHIYVKVDDEPVRYLSRTGNGESSQFTWNAKQTRLNPYYQDGPQFGHSYVFHVYAITGSGEPHHYGPFSTFGPVILKKL